MNTKFPEETLAYIASDATLTSAYIDPALVDKLPNTLTQHPLTLPSPSVLPAHIVTPSQGQPGLVLYTSGSTGTPKGVLLSHDSQWAMISRMKALLGGATGIIAAPLYHMNGLLFLCSILAGAGTVPVGPPRGS